jgi:predicted negative regulator of RcsB-dependent stress response
LERQNVVHKISAAVAKIGRNSSRKYAVLASLPVAENLVETQSIPNISDAQKSSEFNKKSGSLHSILRSFSLLEIHAQL